MFQRLYNCVRRIFFRYSRRERDAGYDPVFNHQSQEWNNEDNSTIQPTITAVDSISLDNSIVTVDNFPWAEPSGMGMWTNFLSPNVQYTLNADNIREGEEVIITDIDQSLFDVIMNDNNIIIRRNLVQRSEVRSEDHDPRTHREPAEDSVLGSENMLQQWDTEQNTQR